MGYAYVTAAGCLWGGWVLFLRRAPEVDPVAQSALALLVIALGGMPWAIAEGRRRARRPNVPAGRHFLYGRPAWAWALVAYTGLGDAANFALYFAALARTTTAVAVLTHYLAPVGVALLAPVALRERAGRRTPAAIALAFAGLALMLLGGGGAVGSLGLGAALGAGSALFFAGNVVCSRALSAHFSAVEMLVWHAWVAVAVLAAIAPPAALHAPPAQLGWVAAGALVCGLLAGVLFLRGVARVPAARAGVLMYFEPLVALCAAWAAFGEVPAPSAALGGACIVGAGVLVVSESTAGPAFP